MGNSLVEIAQHLKTTNKKVQLIYAFNGTGKTRLSQEFKRLIAPEKENVKTDQIDRLRNRILYYNAFTEDLFYWDNDLKEGTKLKLMIQPNTFTDWILREQGQEINVVTTFQRYTNKNLTPHFNAERKEKGRDGKQIVIKAFSEVTFTMEYGNEFNLKDLKISKGEESNFIWSVFYTLLEQIIFTLNDVQLDYPESTPFDEHEYIFIDDPVSSLDDNNLIQLAVELAQLIKLNKSNIKFIITTHNPLFFNVLSNEFGSNDKNKNYNWKSTWFNKARLEKQEDGRFCLLEQPTDSPFAYHLHLLLQLKTAIEKNQIEKYHFNLLRNVLEKTATFLGYKRWEHLLPETNDNLPNLYAKRIINFSSHSKHAAYESSVPKPEENIERQLT